VARPSLVNALQSYSQMIKIN